MDGMARTARRFVFAAAVTALGPGRTRSRDTSPGEWLVASAPPDCGMDLGHVSVEGRGVVATTLATGSLTNDGGARTAAGRMRLTGASMHG